MTSIICCGIALLSIVTLITADMRENQQQTGTYKTFGDSDRFEEAEAAGAIKVWCWTNSPNCNNYDTTGQSSDATYKSGLKCCNTGQGMSYMRHNYLDCYTC